MKNYTNFILSTSILLLNSLAQADIINYPQIENNNLNTRAFKNDKDVIDAYIRLRFNIQTWKNLEPDRTSHLSNLRPMLAMLIDYPVKKTITTAVADGEPKQTDIEALFLGTNTFENNTDYNQTGYTNAFSKEVINSMSTTTTSGWEIGGSLEVTSEVKIPLVTKEGITFTISGRYNSSSSETTTRSTTIIYTSPAQQVFLPPHSKVRVTVSLNRVEASGKYKFFTILDMTPVTLEIHYFGGPHHKERKIDIMKKDIYSILHSCSLYSRISPQLPSGVILDDNNKKVLLEGEGDYIAETGTDYLVKIELIDAKTNKITATIMELVDPISNNVLKIYKQDDELPHTDKD